jgi:hypothetical protein
VIEVRGKGGRLAAYIKYRREWTDFSLFRRLQPDLASGLAWVFPTRGRRFPAISKNPPRGKKQESVIIITKTFMAIFSGLPNDPGWLLSMAFLRHRKLEESL